MSFFFCKAGPNLPKSFLRTDCERSNLLMGFTGTVEGTFEPTTLLEGNGLKKKTKFFEKCLFLSVEKEGEKKNFCMLLSLLD